MSSALGFTILTDISLLVGVQKLLFPLGHFSHKGSASYFAEEIEQGSKKQAVFAQGIKGSVNVSIFGLFDTGTNLLTALMYENFHEFTPPITPRDLKVWKHSNLDVLNETHPYVLEKVMDNHDNVQFSCVDVLHQLS